MSRITPRRPSPRIPIPNGLWSLWDMLEVWGYKFLSIGTALGYIEVDLQNHRRATNGSLIGHGNSVIEPDDPLAKSVSAKLDEIHKLADNIELGAIPANIRRLHVKFLKASRQMLTPVPLYTNDVIEDVERIKSDFLYILSKRLFYYPPPDLVKFYGQPALFGDLVAAKFPTASEDIERAGNCLALGEPTACVLHLHRAMEIIVRRLAKRLHVTVNAKDTMGAVLNHMEGPINRMPDKTDVQKRKKEKWSECRINLSHVKRAWRDPSAHGKTTYGEKEASDIFHKVKDFTQHLATLL